MSLYTLSIHSLLEKLNVRFKFDRRKHSHFHHVSSKAAKDAYDHEMIFFISTGRSGSAFIFDLLGKEKGFEVCHEPFPCLAEFPNLFASEGLGFSKGVLLGARSQRIIDCYNRNNKYVESNQVMSFLIKEISECFPNSKIVHVIRSPYSFVKSAVQKGWYVNDTVWEYGRIKADKDLWDSMTQVQKLTWYWSEVNGIVLSDSAAYIQKDKFLSMRLEDINAKEQLKILSDFIDIDSKFLITSQSKPVNKSKKSEWWCGDNVCKSINSFVDINEVNASIHNDFDMLVKRYHYG